jgi:hypothetical protein
MSYPRLERALTWNGSGAHVPGQVNAIVLATREGR